MSRIKEEKEKSRKISIHSFDISEQKIPRIIEELMDLVGKYKAKRSDWEVKLKIADDPRKPDLYAIIARLAILDMMVIDLERLIQLIVEKKK
ncbi:MAG: hypothetical protein ACW964_08560 [Candidatus Hodarchaeales archaeon]|jgi:hypothetical protein